MKRDLIFEMDYAHPVEKVWRALTDSRILSEWLMPNDFQPRLGHRFQFRTKPAPGFNGIVDCEVIEINAPRRLAFTWKGGPVDSVVTFTLTPVPEGTRLRLEHRGFEGLGAWLVSFILGSGWRKHILREHLPDVLNRMTPDGLAPRTAQSPRKCHP